MIDINEEEEDPNTRIIAPVTKQQWQQQQKQWQQRQQRQPQQEQQKTIVQRVIQMPERFNRVPQNQTEPKPCTLMCGMKMHVTDATKFLASVRKITQNGNRVIFDEDRSFIQHKKTGREMEMKLENGVYKVDVIFMNGERSERRKILIDSGAADNVMPMTALSEVEMQPREIGANFSSANGKKKENLGRKDVKFIPYDQWEAEFGFPFQGRTEQIQVER